MQFHQFWVVSAPERLVHCPERVCRKSIDKIYRRLVIWMVAKSGDAETLVCHYYFLIFCSRIISSSNGKCLYRLFETWRKKGGIRQDFRFIWKMYFDFDGGKREKVEVSQGRSVAISPTEKKPSGKISRSLDDWSPRMKNHWSSTKFQFRHCEAEVDNGRRGWRNKRMREKTFGRESERD